MIAGAKAGSACRPRGSGAGAGGRRRRSRPGRSRARVPPADARRSCCSSREPRPRRPDGPIPGRRADRASCTARARPTCPRSCRTRSAWRRGTCAISWPGRASSRPNATCSRASISSCAASIASRGRRRAASRCSGCPRRRHAVRRGPAGAVAADAGAARRHLAALPAGREVRLLQLAADVVRWAPTRRAIDATLDDAHHRAPYLRFLRESLADLRSR